MEIQGVRRNSIPDDPQEIFHIYEKFLNIDHMSVCVARYVQDKSPEEIAKTEGKSVNTINNWLNKFTDELAFRSYAVLVEKGSFTKDSSIKGVFGLSKNGIERLEREGIHTFEDLENEYKGCTEDGLRKSSSFLSVADRKYLLSKYGKAVIKETKGTEPANIVEKVNSSASETQVECKNSKPMFLIIKELKSRYLGVLITNKGLLKTSYLEKKRASFYHLVNVESKVKNRMLGDISIKDFDGTSKTDAMHSLEEKGIFKLSDFMQYTRSEVENIKYVGEQTVNLIEEELLYRWGVGFKPQTILVVKQEVTDSKYISVEKLSDQPLPKSFLLYSEGKCIGTFSDTDILNLYQDYLENINREEDWLILQELRNRNSELPLGIISLMENTQNGVIPCGILSDKYGMQLLQCVIDFNDEKLSRSQKLYLQQMYNTLLAQEDVNIKDLISFCSIIDFAVPTNRLIYIYKNYKKDAHVFLRRPTNAGSLEEDGVKKLEKYFKDIIQPTHLRIITAYAERLNISYKYIIGKVDYYLNHKKEIGGSVPMLASWFKFDYRAMSLYLSENPNFGSI